jgi:hypothetical protein
MHVIRLESAQQDTGSGSWAGATEAPD